MDVGPANGRLESLIRKARCRSGSQAMTSSLT